MFKLNIVSYLFMEIPEIMKVKIRKDLIFSMVKSMRLNTTQALSLLMLQMVTL